MKNKVVFFEIPAANFTQAKAFYEKVFDWKVDLWGDDGAMAFTTPVDKDQNPIEPGGINGGFYKRKSNSHRLASKRATSTKHLRPSRKQEERSLHPNTRSESGVI